MCATSWLFPACAVCASLRCVVSGVMLSVWRYRATWPTSEWRRTTRAGTTGHGHAAAVRLPGGAAVATHPDTRPSNGRAHAHAHGHGPNHRTEISGGRDNAVGTPAVSVSLNDGENRGLISMMSVRFPHVDVQQFFYLQLQIIVVI